MEMVKETCPWCRKEVRVEAGRERRYTCSWCKKDFTFIPGPARAEEKSPAQPSQVVTAPPSDFVETPFVNAGSRRLLAAREGFPGWGRPERIGGMV